MRVARDEKTGLFYRPWTIDLDVIRSTYREYDISSLNSKDIVCDIGANIGAFSKRVYGLVQRVLAFEPDPENYRILKANTINHQTIWRMRRAIVNNNDEYRKFYINEQRNRATHSLHITRGRKEIIVKCVNFHYLLYPQFVRQCLQPTVIKIDIEGGEYELLQNTSLPNSVRLLIVEFHFGKRVWKNENYPKTVEHILAQGFVSDKHFTLIGRPRTKTIHFRRWNDTIS